MPKNSFTKGDLIDRVGACASAVCAVHCLLTGVALGLLSVMGIGFIGNIWVDIGFISVAVIVGAIALRHGVKCHKSYVPALFFITGLIAIAVGHLGELDHDHTNHVHSPFATVMSVVGGSCLVIFHVLNLRLQHAKHCCGEGKICTHSHRDARAD